MKIFKYFFEALIIYIFFAIIKLIGLSLSRIIFSMLFKKIGPVIRSNNIPIKNLTIFSDKLNVDQKKEVISNMWSNYGKVFVEYIFLKKFRKCNSHINIKGEEILDQLSKANKPVIFVSGHFANFEMMSMEITKKNINVATIYRPLNNIFLNPFMEYLRKKYICKNQIKKGRLGVKETVEYLKKNYSIALMIDQRVSEGEETIFFKKTALTTTLPAQLATKYKINIVPIFIERKKNDFFEMQIQNPIEIHKFKNKLEITRKLNQVIEEMIISNPNQWIWTHDRWK